MWWVRSASISAISSSSALPTGTATSGSVYPLMRGVAPMIVASTSGIVLGEHVPLPMLAGIAIICGGVLTLAFESRNGGRRPWALRC